MTTEVINGVPRKLLEQVTIELEHDTDRYMLGRELRALLATAQPADHSEHDLNMVSQPAADGERGEYGDAYQGAREDLAIWKRRALEAEYKMREQDRIIENLGNALNDENGPTFMGEPVLQASAAQPQQAVAVTDVSTLKIALAELHKCGVKPGSLPHMVLTNLIDATHKTGEEE